MIEAYPERWPSVRGPCTRRIVSQMLRNRRYSLVETRHRKDQGIVKIYMKDQWMTPMLFQIGEYQDGLEPHWGGVYDRAMQRHLATKDQRYRLD